jgi:PAS domain S-box-containing protein
MELGAATFHSFFLARPEGNVLHIAEQLDMATEDELRAQVSSHQIRGEDPDILRGLAKGEFVPFFQPLVTLRTGQLAGFEMLARWQHPTRGLVLPGAFIAAAERDGWIEELTRQILQKAFVAAAAIPDPLTLAINISPLQLRDITLPRQISALAERANFPLSRLVLEITESALIDDLEKAMSVVAELKEMGCRLALDDFGTGYSSLAHLQALPLDKLKVDRSFVSSMIEKRQSRKIVAAVVGLGQSLDLITVAEGIETREQAEMIVWLGCTLGQGYFFGRPIPAEELAACVAAPRPKLHIPLHKAWKGASGAYFDAPVTQRLAHIQAVYEGAPVGLAFVDRNLRYLNLNQRLADMNGASIEAHLGSMVAEMIPDLFPQLEPYLRRALAGEAVMDVEVQQPWDGRTRSCSYHPVRDEAGEVIGLSLAAVDITDHKRAQKALEESEAHYRRMVALNPQVLWIMDPDGRNLDVSSRWANTGTTKLHIKEHDWLKSVHPADIKPTLRAIAASRREGSEIDVQYRVADGKGKWIWKRSRGEPRFDDQGKIVCWYGSVQDSSGPRESPKPVARVQPPARIVAEADPALRTIPPLTVAGRPHSRYLPATGAALAPARARASRPAL